MARTSRKRSSLVSRAVAKTKVLYGNQQLDFDETFSEASTIKKRFRGIAGRRLVFGTLVVATILTLFVAMTNTVVTQSFSVPRILMLTAFLITLPWLVIGFWHSVIGMSLMFRHAKPEDHVCQLETLDPDVALPERSTALLSCIRNEDVTAVGQKLEAMLEDLAKANALQVFALYILSDTDEEDVGAQEEALAAQLQQRWGTRIPVVYRRRAQNTGYKAGNIADYCRTYGERHEFFITLDADSYMAAHVLKGLVSRMVANPNLGILQTLAVGLPSKSFFARVFQWGMRLGMRSYTLGAAWWQGGFGPYWGHNAILRTKAFTQHCMLPVLKGKGPLSGPILSHDQVEAALMAKGGYEVRVWPQEGGSYEENPPNLLGFIDRDLRWCHGNMQYLRLFGIKGLKPISLIQLFLAVLMFVSSPAWLLFLFIGALGPYAFAENPITYDGQLGIVMLATIMTMVFAPVLSSMFYIGLSRARAAVYGGTGLFSLGAVGFLFFSIMLSPLMAIAHSVFMALLFMGKKCSWRGQSRDVTEISWSEALSKFWPQLLFGIAGLVWVSDQSGLVMALAAPVLIGPLLVVPFAVLTSRIKAGQLAVRLRLWDVPEEISEPEELRQLEVVEANAATLGAR
ncbi:glucans biosynthesis glucosyltransferase MdoH [Rhodobacteraceae bacterium RKSG542]|uniref:glucans biosynthesis glucosyltransferase MdoH n=1 Tax=Pseudovibrio flavus TaxID=2529854 RepID=UPI0012BCA8AD|nr:glucans biosynthesis glucosyltransferase MdoH [Pseudovibrio flavus]MTI17698.1 glucans biosynthesis glucosyltransferase MdoH [Pseudovibrio flavus]